MIGEPLRSALAPNDMAALLHAAGFSVDSDTDTADWARALCGAQTRSPRVSYERIALAHLDVGR